MSIIIYSKANCPYCVRAKELLTNKKVQYEEVRVDLDPVRLQEMQTRSQRRTVPQIFINDHYVGGFDDLYALEQRGELDRLINVSST